MVAALGHALDAGPRRPLVLVGYSGGGALALLIADRVAAVKAVVTLAANLDLAGWTELHGYEALTDSLDPLSVRRLPTGCEIHIAAAHDSVVPPSLVRNAVARRPGALLWVESGDHACCWADRWPGIERRVVARLDAAGCLAAN
jgi:pimeloyl-ACP methyl ester carboxylesterase